MPDAVPVVETFVMKREEATNMKQTTHLYFTDIPISYHLALDEAFDDWAVACGWEPQPLRHASEQAIRSRHHDAVISHECYKARGNHPDVFTLSLGSVEVIYTVEPREVVIRGYGWEIDHEPLDDYDGGGFYSEASWYRRE
jgi:hypothetical protein